MNFPSRFEIRAFPAAILLSCFTPHVVAETRYVIEDLGPTSNSVPVDPMGVFGINASGQVAVHNSIAGSGVFSAFLYSGFAKTPLGALPGDPSSQAGAINDSGQIVGHSGSAPATGSFLTSPQKMFLYNNGSLQNLGGSTPSVFGINNAGQIVGNSSNHAFLLTNGVFRDLGTFGGTSSRATAINASGQVVGWATLPSTDRHAFIYNGTTLRDLGTLGGATSQAQGINAAGQVVGYGLTAAGETHAFLFSNETMNDLGLPAGWTETRAFAINSSGKIVGWGRSTAGPRGFTYANGVFTDLNTVIPLRSANNDGFSSVLYAAALNDAGQITGYGNYVESGVSGLHAFLLTPVPEVAPAALTSALGSTVRFTATSPLPNAAYQWSHNGADLAGANSASLLLPQVSSGDSGFYVCTVSNANARVQSAPVTLAVVSTPTPGRIVNLAIRTNAGTGPQTLIVGLAIGGVGTTGTKPVLVRGTGPALATFGVPGTVTDPKIELFSGNIKLTENDNWAGDSQVSAIGAQVGAFALPNAASKDAALYAPSLATGGYTVQVSGVGGATGAALAEIYDATPTLAFTPDTPRLINVSARAQVGTNSDILIAGFVIAGSTAKTVLIRGIGPTLTSFGVASALADPQLQLFQGSNVVATNDNWGGDAQLGSIGSAVGAFPIGNPASKDAMLLVTLPPGSYTAQLSGVGNTTGVGLIEIYEVP